MNDLLWIALGSALGGVLRHAVSGLVARSLGNAFPWGTLAVNGSGAAAIGVVAAFAEAGLLDVWANAWALLVVGLLAGYTTVSAVSLQTLGLVRQGAAGRAAANLILSLLLCLGGAALTYGATAAWIAPGNS